MSNRIARRDFLAGRAVASAAIGSLFGLEQRALAGRAEAPVKPADGRPGAMPVGRIRDVTISRIVCGGNLIGGFAHSRDLLYVSSLLKHYFTDQKIIETLEICEQCGINTLMAGPGSASLLKKYRDQHGGRIQWICQCVPTTDDITGDAKKAAEAGAVGAYVIGNVGDKWCRAGRADLVARFVEFVKSQGLIAGVAGHNLGTPAACERAGVDADFYMKTLHRTDYWSARRPGQTKDVIDNYGTDNYWDKDPRKTIEYMQTVKKPWIAYKVLAAGAIHPAQGFRFAFENGADFACVGMFDFQVREDAAIARDVLSAIENRPRAWMA